MSDTNVSEASSAFSRFHLPPSHPQLISKIPKILPHERVFPIQIGSELFKLSGASLSSDAPSYFSQYFLCQIKGAEENGEDICSAIRTLYIDRDPETFKDISLHLQGYHVAPRDGTHFVRLFADAQFYTLPKLMSQLYEESIFMSIGHREFQIPRDLFQGPGNSPNFFSLGYAIFFSTPEEIFPGLKREGLIRPPSIQPPAVANRSADIFADLVNLLKGYPVHVRDEEHRASLLRDCRYFNFKGLEQRLVPHHISFNQARQRSEILLRIEDLLKSGISFAPDPVSTPVMNQNHGVDASAIPSGWVHYARPFVDDAPHELILEVGGENTRIHTGAMRAEFFGQVRARVAKLFEVVAAKLNLPPTTQPLGLLMARGGAGSQPPTPGHTALSEDLVRIAIEPDAYIELDGSVYPTHTVEGDEGLNAPAPFSSHSSASVGHDGSPASSSMGSVFGGHARKRRRLDIAPTGQVVGGGGEWVVKKGQWRLKIQASQGGKSAVECVLVAVRLEAYSSEQARNAQRGFLS
ncbi:BTB/POZ domain-containing protein [Pestalotiopsis sp. NC0098]|nr:BTB/POZ domain-containing protein [Pestalotiopsis sp. NC0098]